MGSNIIPKSPTKERDGIFYYLYIIGYLIVLPLWLPIIILDVIFNFTGQNIFRKGKKMDTEEVLENIEEKHVIPKTIKTKTRKQQKQICPMCGELLIKRVGRFGVFYGCSSYPKCRFTKKF